MVDAPEDSSMSGDAVCRRANEETSFQLCDEKRYVVYRTYPLSSVAMKAAESRENPQSHPTKLLMSTEKNFRRRSSSEMGSA